MFIQGLGRKKNKEVFETLYAEYPQRDGGKRVFVLETRPADRPNCPGENRWARKERRCLNKKKAIAFLKQKETILSSSGKEAIGGRPNERARLIIKPACPQGWLDRVVPGWATHIKTKGVRSWEDGAVGTQFLAAFDKNE